MHDAAQGDSCAAATIRRNRFPQSSTEISGERHVVRARSQLSHNAAVGSEHGSASSRTTSSSNRSSRCRSSYGANSHSNGTGSQMDDSSSQYDHSGSSSSSSECSYTASPSCSDSSSQPPSDADWGEDEEGDANHVRTSVSPSSSSLLNEVWRRTCVLMMLLLLQSLSQFVLEAYEPLIQEHIFIPLFLTMLIGAGGNAGNQVTVRAITGLTTGEIRPRDWARVVLREFSCGLVTASAVALVGFARVNYFFSNEDQWYATKAVTLSLFAIVVLSAVLGAVLPFLFIGVGLSCEHAAPTIQVVMDVLGVLLTCGITAATVPAPSTANTSQNYSNIDGNATARISES